MYSLLFFMLCIAAEAFAGQFSEKYNHILARYITKASGYGGDAVFFNEGKTALHQLIGCPDRLAPQENWSADNEISWRTTHIKRLLNEGIKLKQDQQGDSPYHDGIKAKNMGNARLVAFILNLSLNAVYHKQLVQHINFDSPNHEGKPPIKYATREVLKYLLSSPQFTGAIKHPDTSLVAELTREIQEEDQKREEVIARCSRAGSITGIEVAKAFASRPAVDASETTPSTSPAEKTGFLRLISTKFTPSPAGTPSTGRSSDASMKNTFAPKSPSSMLVTPPRSPTSPLVGSYDGNERFIVRAKFKQQSRKLRPLTPPASTSGRSRKPSIPITISSNEA